MTRLTIRGGRVLDPQNQIDAVMTLHIDQGQIVAFGEAPVGFAPDKEIQAEGHWVLPGLIDAAVRLHEPGHPQSELKAALQRGIFHVLALPDSQPVMDTATIIEPLCTQAQSFGGASLHPIGALTQGLQGEQLADLLSLSSAGAIAFSNAQAPIHNRLVLLQCYQFAASNQLPVIIRAEDPDLIAGTVAHEGIMSTRLGLPSSPSCAESIAIATHLELISHTGVSAHFSALSAARSVELIADAKARGLPVSADVAIHHLHLTEMDVAHFNTDCHLQPPLRSQRDQAALLDGINSGVIDGLVSDHQPREALTKKAPFGESSTGLSGLDTFLSLVIHAVNELGLDAYRAIEAMTAFPARRFGIDGGHLSLNAPADFVIVNPDATWTVSPEALHSAGKNTPFTGWMLPGVIKHLIRDGNVLS